MLHLKTLPFTRTHLLGFAPFETGSSSSSVAATLSSIVSLNLKSTSDCPNPYNVTATKLRIAMLPDKSILWTTASGYLSYEASSTDVGYAEYGGSFVLFISKYIVTKANVIGGQCLPAWIQAINHKKLLMVIDSDKEYETDSQKGGRPQSHCSSFQPEVISHQRSSQHRQYRWRKCVG